VHLRLIDSQKGAKNVQKRKELERRFGINFEEQRIKEAYHIQDKESLFKEQIDPL